MDITQTLVKGLQPMPARQIPGGWSWFEDGSSLLIARLVDSVWKVGTTGKYLAVEIGPQSKCLSLGMIPLGC